MTQYLREISLLRILPVYIMGIITAVFFQNEILNQFVFILFISLFVLFIVYQIFTKKNYSFRWVNGFLIIIISFIIGYIITFFNTDLNNSIHYSHFYKEGDKVFVSVVIDEKPIAKRRSVKFVGKIKTIGTKPVTGRMLFYAEDSLGQKLSYGDRLLLNITPTKLQKPLNPAQFNYARFMGFRQINHQVYFTSEQLIDFNPESRYFSIYHWSYIVRDYLSDLLKKQFNDQKAYDVATSLLLGYREKLDNETIRAYSASGAMHVLAVSGLHVGIFYWILNQLLFFLDKGKRKKQFKILLLIFIIWGYAFLTGLSPSIQRAALMFSLVGIAQNIKRSSSIYNAIVVSAFTLLCFNPYLLMEVGFQLSYAALLGIIIIQPILYKQVYVENKILDWIWSISCVSIAAQVATLPIGLLYFHQFPVYFMVSNLIVIPAAMILLPLGIFFFASAPFALLNNLLGEILQTLFKILNFLVFNIESLPGSLLIGFSPTILETWFSYILVISLLLYYHYRKKMSLYAFLISVILLIVLFDIKSWNNIHNQSITFYAIKGNTALDINYRNKNYFIADESLINNEDQMLFSVIHNWWQKGYTHNTSIYRIDVDSIFNNAITFYDKPLLQTRNEMLIIIDKDIDPDNYSRLLNKNIDIILFKENPYKWLSYIREMPENTKLVVDGSNSYHFIRKLKSMNPVLETHYLMEEGAFIYQM